MVISGKIKKKKALIITQDRINALFEIIKKYGDRIVIKATTYSDSEIAFDTIEELFNYDNFKDRRIKELNIKEYNEHECVVDIIIGKDFNPFKVINYIDTVYCSYNFKSVDSESIFVRDFDEWFDKSKSSYWVLGKLSLFGIITLLALGTVYWIFLYGDKYKESNLTKVESIIIMICSLMFGSFLVAFAKFVDNKILSNLFPPVVFCWGEEAKRFEKWSKLRTNIFWGIIIAILIGLITSYLFKIITGG